VELGLKGKKVIIAGGSRGIGLAIAEAFLKEGALVAIIARDSIQVNESASLLRNSYGNERVLAFSMDCADPDSWMKITPLLISLWGTIHICIANAGNGKGTQDPLPESHQFKESWRTNFSTAEETARATLPLLLKSQGCLLFISSIAGIEAIGAPTDYSVSKSALIALTKQMGRRLAPAVRVNCLAPGNIYFPGGTWDNKLKQDPERVQAIIKTSVPMNRFGEPHEIADMAVFLCSERAGFITGACFVIDGGQTVSI
jgi:3-oxoacyl-[acyl-carrier protein] reductase